jgi:hypothetical protein
MGIAGGGGWAEEGGGWAGGGGEAPAHLKPQLAWRLVRGVHVAAVLRHHPQGYAGQGHAHASLPTLALVHGVAHEHAALRNEGGKGRRSVVKGGVGPDRSEVGRSEGTGEGGMDERRIWRGGGGRG